MALLRSAFKGKHARGACLLLALTFTMQFVLQTGSSHLPPPAYSQLKRGRPRDVFKFNASKAPKLPPIHDIDILLEIFTHPSITQGSEDRMDTGGDAYGDNKRLSFLGEITLNSTVTDVLFKHRPVLRAQEMEVSGVDSSG